MFEKYLKERADLLAELSKANAGDADREPSEIASDLDDLKSANQDAIQYYNDEVTKLVRAAETLVASAEKLADKTGVDFSMELCYGAGAWYNPAGSETGDWDSSGYAEEGEWQASSQSC